MENKKMKIILICEKPDAALRIANALAEGTMKIRRSKYGINYYEFERNGKSHVAVAAIGHLFSLKQKTKGWHYPVYAKEIEWSPAYKSVKKSKFSQKYYRTIEDVAKLGSDYILACDFDTEGTVIGWHIIKFICGKGDAKRMIFSTLTATDLIDSYEKAMHHIDWENVVAGETRHILDWLYGISTTRAMTMSIKSHSKRFVILSAGRVQGPTLSLLAEREMEIKSFVPTPYWQLQLTFLADGNEIIAVYEKDKIWDEREADRIFKDCKDKPATVDSFSKERYKQSPPPAFNITSLQTEAYRLFGYSPQQTLSIAQKLYTSAHISYPRTSLDFNESIYILNETGILERVKIGKFVDDNIKLNKNVVDIDGSKELEINGYRTFSIDKNTGKAEIKKITHLIRHPAEEELYEIMTKEGRKIRVTKSHSLFTFRKGKITSTPTDKLNIGDFIAFSKSISLNSSLREVNLLDRIKRLSLEDKFTITNIKGTPVWNLTFKMKNGNDYRFRNSVPLDVLLKHTDLESIKDLPLRLRARSGKNKFYIDSKLYITPEFARLLGYFDSEGGEWHRGGKKSSYEIIFTQADKSVMNDIAYCVTKVLNFVPRIYLAKGNAPKVRLFGKSFYYILKLFGCLGNCLTKEISDIILSSPDSIVAEYLKAYFAGDGYVHVSGRGLCYATTGQHLSDGLLFLLSRLGIYSIVKEVEPSIKRRLKHKEYIIGIYGHENVKKFVEIIGLVKDFHKLNYRLLCCKTLESSHSFDRIDKGLIDWHNFVDNVSFYEKSFTGSHRTKSITLNQISKITNFVTNPYIERLKSFIRSNTGLAQIVSINKVKSTSSFVYDISVEDNENFIGGFGQILCHNSSEKLPPQINYEKIIEVLSSIEKYRIICNSLLKTRLKPVQGKGTDPAHEAIHPTIQPPAGKLSVHETRIYDLVCRRFLSAFGEDAIREALKLVVGINGHKFLADGKRTVDSGWMKIYGPYARFKEVSIPDLKKGDVLDVKSLENLSKETTPPDRYSQASVIKEMEKRGLGTRATRANILQTLYDRDYITDRRIVVTDLGLKVASTLKSYVPDFVDEDLTRKFEEDLEKVRDGKIDKESVIRKAEIALEKICREFKENEDKIGKELGEAIVQTQEEKSIIGACPNCGKDLKRLYSPKTRKYFVGCSGYKDGCRTAFPLPPNAAIYSTNKICDKCKTPIVKVYRKGRRPFSMCLSPTCETKAEWGKKKS